ncbi:MAG: AmmeMemoRadiSam system protein B [Spirochaetes bacterium]|nr:AmmeMemoRadiSam system protein B [Spirochaetota bacterium]
MLDVREPVVAGMFYTSNEKELANEIDRYLENSSAKKITKDIFCIIAPHAGYSYSGAIAAAAYANIAGKEYDNVLLLGPSHRWYFKGISVGMYDSYETPLGRIPVDKEDADRLIKSTSMFNFVHKAHESEHSLEVQLPFLQRTLKNDFKIINILFGAVDTSHVEDISDILKDYIESSGKKTLIVCSTDLSHDYPYNESVKMDKIIAGNVEKLDYKTLNKNIDSHKCEACGHYGLMVALSLAGKKGYKSSLITELKNSGDVTRDKMSRIVGYLSAIIYS